MYLSLVFGVVGSFYFRIGKFFKGLGGVCSYIIFMVFKIDLRIRYDDFSDRFVKQFCLGI